ncbi:MAG: hypothetical protein WA871_13405 [Candidatus Acidiferrales bacterium]
MNARLKLLFCTLALLFAGTASTAPMPGGAHKTPKSSSTCFAGFPQGVFYGSPYGVTNAQLAFFLTASYTLKDPTLAHASMPGLLVADMNPVSTRVLYAVADGTAGNFSIHLNVFQDATQDHYGMTVVVNGPSTVNFNGYDPTHIQTDVQYFQFTLPAQYVSGSQLIQDAGTKIATYLDNGWTCN